MDFARFYVILRVAKAQIVPKVGRNPYRIFSPVPHDPRS